MMIRGQEPKSPWEIVDINWVTALPPGGDISYNACLVLVDRYCQPVTQNRRTSMTANYHKPMVEPRYHQNMELSQTSSKGIKLKREATTFQIQKSHHHRTRNNKVVAEHKPSFSPLI
ncbi:hypothetical protein O181_105618 [Austropuccinia psidii MF-1]|uniref:Uncharacterized protein n=1 Tax=Austropuccinia psidii MF-1 TaxID=1389203 RepID=A0A9Q3JP96_9BASI|nr:hypothetical protein [Austropuccinia psidii MF-1]